MEETLRQLGELLRDSVPTIILFLVVYIGYRVIVHKPMMRVLAERYDKTQGAVEKARADVAAAEAKTAEYEQRLRDARLAVIRAQEARLHQVQQARAEVLNQAREQASATVAEARAGLDKDIQAAKTSLQGDAERLSNEVIATVLRPAGVTPSTVGGAR